MTAPLADTLRKVDISFGFVSFTVTLHGTVASEPKDKPGSGGLTTVCTSSHGVMELSSTATPAPRRRSSSPPPPPPTLAARVSQTLKCSVCDSDEHLGKAVKANGGYVVLPDEVLTQASEADKAYSKSIQVRVHDVKEVEAQTRPTGQSYYLGVPDDVSNGYVVLLELIRKRKDLAFMAHFAIKEAALPYRLVADGKVITMIQMADPSLVRARPVVQGEITPAHMKFASELADEELSDYEPSDYDRPRVQVINAFVAGKSLVSLQTPDKSGEVMDLLDQLQSSIRAARSNKAPAKKVAAKKTAKKTVAKKSKTVTPIKRAS